MEDFAAGRIPAEAALARLALSGLSPAQIESMLPGTPALRAAFDVYRDHLDRLTAMLSDARIDHASAADPQAIACMFDRAVQAAPEASVAAYTLGDARLLARATAEIVGWLRGFMRPGWAVLDLGCGIGRVAAALSPHCAHVLAVDVSPAMIEEARRRHARLPNVSFDVTDGGPPRLGPASLDMVLAVDSFPYLVLAGVADAHVAAAVHMLRPGGILAILNLSYGDASHNEARAMAWAREFGLGVVLAGTRPFSTWDGAAFVFRRSETIG